jgi:predicted DsbA family dithiol-disulfide isomerase
MEPAWRRLRFHYGGHIDVRYGYGALLYSWRKFADVEAGIFHPKDVAPHWRRIAEQSGQPIDERIWLNDPPHSSYPPSTALHAVRMLEPGAEPLFLRRLREAVFLEARNIARTDVLQECAEEIELDVGSFTRCFESEAALQAFETELGEVRSLGVRGFPTLIMRGWGGKTVVVRGAQPYAGLEEALRLVTGLPPAGSTPTTAEALDAYRAGTTREFAELLNLDVPAAVRALESAGARRGTGAGAELWVAGC